MKRKREQRTSEKPELSVPVSLNFSCLPLDFFNRATTTVATNLLGKYLVCKRGRKILSFMITDVEAYDGFDDKASHAHRGETERNAPMFGEAGHWYVYLVYGMHWMLNIVTGEKEYPAAVLIRGVEGFSGPARVTKLLGVTKTVNGKKADYSSGFWIEDRSVKIARSSLRRGPRIGVDYAGVWAKKPYRFYLGTDLKKIRAKRI